jgi:GTP-binding protein
MALEISPRVRPATVAIVGRPNVGKSALFNRLVGKRLAIVEDTPGVTRDRLYALAEWQHRTFSVVDTAGIDPDANDDDDIGSQTRAQAEIAAREADVIVFVVDASAGLSPLDEDVVAIMRRTKRPVLLVANKAESERVKLSIPGEFARLGFGEPFAVSAIHGEGTGDLLDAIVERLPPAGEAIEAPDELSLAIVGRPNVGKSSLLNALLGEERSIVSDVPGTTRDAIGRMA